MVGERMPILGYWSLRSACYTCKSGQYSLIANTSMLGVKVITTLLLPTSLSVLLQ